MRGKGEGTQFKRPDGKGWIARLHLGYKDGKRQRRDFHAKTQMEARRKMLDFKRRMEQGENPAGQKMTVGQFLSWWEIEILDRDHARKQRTKQDYKDIVRLYLRPHLGALIISKLTDKHIRAMLKIIQDQGLSSRRRQYIHAVLRIVLSDAEREELVHKNYAKLVTVKSTRKLEIRPYNSVEVAKLLQFVDGHPWEPLIILAVTTGLRQGELLALTWDAVDEPEFIQLHVRRTLIRTQSIRSNPHDWWSLETPKTEKSNRSMWLPDMTRQALHKLKERQTICGFPNNFLFTRHDGTPISAGMVDHLWDKIRKESGLRHQRFQDLRHGAASYWLNSKMSLREIQGFMGHSSYNLTANLYTHLMPAASQEAAKKMDAFLKEAING